LADLGLVVVVERVTDYAAIAGYGVMSPFLAAVEALTGRQLRVDALPASIRHGCPPAGRAAMSGPASGVRQTPLCTASAAAWTPALSPSREIEEAAVQEWRKGATDLARGGGEQEDSGTGELEGLAVAPQRHLGLAGAAGCSSWASFCSTCRCC
jgi:hypothetical protein